MPAEILQPLYTAATTKMQRSQFAKYWAEKELDVAFLRSKQLLKNCVRLTYPNANNPLSLSCDALAEAIGSVLEEFVDGGEPVLLRRLFALAGVLLSLHLDLINSPIVDALLPNG